jgi:hypothetical protein
MPPIPEAPPDLDADCPWEQDALLPRRHSSAVSLASTVRHGGREEWLRGRLTLKATPSHSNAILAECSIKNGTLSMAKQPASSPGNMSDPSAVLAEVPVDQLAVGLLKGRTDMMMLATLHKGRMYDEIYCVAAGQAKRNQWIAVFRRMGVPVFDVSEGTENARELRL